MCGIAGFISQQAPASLLDRQLNAIVHRGPDGEGRYEQGSLHLGMRRLSIIDLAHGWQPLLSRNGRVKVFQNGEIYNYKKLAADLKSLGYIFNTSSDTEVIAHGYDAWGIEGLLNKIDGMYAIALVDLDARILHLARDRFGEKPLYYSYNNHNFAYASSMKAVAAAPWVNLELNPWGLEQYMACHFVSGRQTIIKDIFKLLPGERLEIDVNAFAPPRLTRYYRPVLQQPRHLLDDELESILNEAVKSRLVADVPVGIFLSGGIDSSLISVFAARHAPNIEAFCVSFDDSEADESVHAKAVADHLDINLNTIRFDVKDFTSLLPTVCSALDEPIGDQALLPLHLLSSYAATKVKVVLSGEGADELFGGYGYYNEKLDLQNLQTFSCAYDYVHNCQNNSYGLLVEERAQTQSGFPLLTSQEEREQIFGRRSYVDLYEKDLLKYISAAYDPIQRKGLADVYSWLSDDLLVKADRMTMASSIEGRCPFLSPQVVERALTLPVMQKLSGDESKVALRRLAKKFLPASVVERRKHGFVLPMKEWIQYWFDQSGGMQNYLVGLNDLGINLIALEKLYAQDVNQQRGRLYFAIIALSEWWKFFQSDVIALRNESAQSN